MCKLLFARNCALKCSKKSNYLVWCLEMPAAINTFTCGPTNLLYLFEIGWIGDSICKCTKCHRSYRRLTVIIFNKQPLMVDVNLKVVRLLLFRSAVTYNYRLPSPRCSISIFAFRLITIHLYLALLVPRNFQPTRRNTNQRGNNETIPQ